MSTEPVEGRLVIRQFRVTITEQPLTNELQVGLRWRLFPCEAMHWDGYYSCLLPADLLPINSEEALRQALAQVALEGWDRGLGRR